ncbi:phage tail protein [Streptomyces sp. A13(2022)]|uniref:phage tail tube protein n=1 Tax=Streptomyces sp. A13(2022) TaxID=2964768 RepID=UPI0021DA8271|nr:phage tail protein [Streptomyces sp. A13(2022)]MCU8589922.1 phage tail protein [Streptomyces sp. A13(2022)]
MSTPTPPVLEDGLRNQLIRKQLVQAIYAADYSVAAVTAPFDEATGALVALPTGYVPIGYTTDDGLTFTSDLSMADVTSSQSVEPTRSDVESEVLTGGYAPQETNPAAVSMYKGLPLSGDGSLPGIGEAWEMTRPSVPRLPYYRLLFIGLDYGDDGGEIYIVKHYPKARVTSKDDQQWARSTETQWPVTVQAYRDPVLLTSEKEWVDGPGWRALAPSGG